MLKVGNNIIKLGGNWLNAVPGSGPEPEPPTPSPVLNEVTIGNQTWLANNLDYDDGGEGIVKLDNVTYYGRNIGTHYFYTYDAMTRIANSIEGWHMPSQAEWNTLISTAGIENLKSDKPTSQTMWDSPGTNSTGFDLYCVVPLNADKSYTALLDDYGKFTSFRTTDGYKTIWSDSYIDNYNYDGVYFPFRLIKDT